nr:hypothetical protein [Tanacetum cinerariifolium]
MEADYQAIQTILMGLPEDIYIAVDSCETAQKIWLRVQQMMKGSDIGIQEKKAKLMQMVEGNCGNQFRQYVGQNVGNQNGYNAVQNVRNQVVSNAVQNPRIQNVGNHNGLIVVIRIANQNVIQNGNGNVVAARADGNGDLDEIEEVNANCILIENLQQASTSGTQTDKALIHDSNGLAEVSEQKNTTKGTSVYTKFSKQSILGKLASSSGPKLYSVIPFPKSKVIPKVGESNALSKPVTSNSAPSSRESTVVNNKRVIAPGIFRINHFKASRVYNFVPNKHVKASVRTKLITISQPYVITKKDVNSNTNGFLLKMLKALLGPEDHCIGTILRHRLLIIKNISHLNV